MADMYEDSQRFSEEEGDESSHVFSYNPRSTATYASSRMNIREGEVELQDPTTNRTQFGVDEDESPLGRGTDEVVDTPGYDNVNTHIREESIQRILSRLSPNGQRTFLRALSEGESDVRPPFPFIAPETDSEDEHSELGESMARRSEIDYLLDSPIPELTTKSLIPPPGIESIQSRPSMTTHPNVTVRGNKLGSMKVYTEFKEVDRHFREELPVNPCAGSVPTRKPTDDILPSQQYVRPKPFLPSEAERSRVQKNLFPSVHARDRIPNINSRKQSTSYVMESTDSCARTTGATHVVWSYKGSLPVVNEAGLPSHMAPPGTTNPNKTYPKLLSGVEMFNSPRSPLEVGREMLYAERTGAGHPIESSEGTVEYRYFRPIETSFAPVERGSPRDGHSVAPLKGHIDPPVGGGTNRYTTRPGSLQIFSGSGGEMPKNVGRRLVRPTPNEFSRGTPLDGIRPPRPPQLQNLEVENVREENPVQSED